MTKHKNRTRRVKINRSNYCMNNNITKTDENLGNVQYQLTNTNYNVANNQSFNSLPSSVNCNDANSLNSHYIIRPDKDIINDFKDPLKTLDLKKNSLYRILCGESQQFITNEVNKCVIDGNCDPTNNNAPFNLYTFPLPEQEGNVPLSLFLSTPPCIDDVYGLYNSDTNTFFRNPYLSLCNANNIPSDITSPGGSPIANNSLSNRDQSGVFYQNYPIPNKTTTIASYYKPENQGGVSPGTNEVVWASKDGETQNFNYQTQLNNLNLFFSEPQTNPEDINSVCCIGPEGNCVATGGGTVNSYTFPVNPFTENSATIFPTTAQVQSCLGKPVKYGCLSGPNGAGVCSQSAIGQYDTLAECQSSCGCFGCKGGSTCEVVVPPSGTACPFVSLDACENNTGCSIPASSDWIFYLILGIIFFIALFLILRAISNKL